MYAKAVTARLEYIVKFYGNALFGGQLRITTDKQEYAAAPGPKLNYSDDEFSDEDFTITPVTLLFEKDIRQQRCTTFEINFHRAFFQKKHKRLRSLIVNICTFV